MNIKDNLPIILFATQAEWEAWLKEHHAEAKGIWLKFAKKASQIASINYAQALEEALCYGWIDGQKASFDEQHWLLKFTPRRPKSIWSQINREKALALIEAGKMQPAGLQQIERAKADGRWDAAYASQKNSDIPADLQSELAKNPQALAFFNTLNSQNRYAIIFRLQTAKKAETRAARLQKFVEMLSRQEKIHP
ncbi:hypothetical protein EPA93_37765 [Ktedonosporobacter rubrisoli]|uniref:Bacteriocin-protection protein n=1 Tax=Ktedonosporobacter rubrisoli TaxID=2509675 RepID=A0A4P6K1R7_KTERU|nr:YdeI/OmpD-associated family protein [Ktedonosporobacter rubrisoli]QBD81416.1 hypothetical protein EPA93_37765 [Ktedonosporobacter rubrisoli]